MHDVVVLRSINLPGETVCVDIFRRADGSFGYDEFRRDPEDARGWFSLRHAGARRFATEQEAMAAAIAAVDWLGALIETP